MKHKRLYRATAYYAEGTPRANVIVRHFQTKLARDLWAENRREGYPEQPPQGFLGDGRPAIPPADRVETADSDPITFPADRTPVDGSGETADPADLPTTTEALNA